MEIDPEKYPNLAHMIKRDLGDDGGAGVREKRKPKPHHPSSSEALSEPKSEEAPEESAPLVRV